MLCNVSLIRCISCCLKVFGAFIRREGVKDDADPVPQGSDGSLGRLAEHALSDEHEPGRIEVEPALEPRLATAQDVGPLLLGRLSGLF